MASPVSFGDLVLLIQGISRLANVLNSQAVESFGRYQRIYKNFVRTAEQLNLTIAGNNFSADHHLRKMQRDIHKMLRNFFNNINVFKPYLRKGRVKRSVRNAIAKFRWARHGQMLKELTDDINRQLGLMSHVLNHTPGIMHTTAAASSSRTSSQSQEYYAILVTKPPVHMYGPISDQLYRTPDEPSPIPFNSTESRNIPSMTASLVFRRHFALCLVRKDIWECTDATLAEKFEDQLFWDYYGNNSQYSRGRRWSSSSIREINGIQQLGIVPSGKNAAQLCTKIYLQLQRKWQYRNIWWNAADFALTLACLLISDEAIAICRMIWRRLIALRAIEVISPRGRNITYSCMAGAVGFYGGIAITIVTGGAAAPVAMPMALGSWGVGFGSEIAEQALRHGEQERRTARLMACRELVKRYPRLQQLFGQG